MRLRRPGWRDPRLLLGIVLIGASVALGSGLVSAAGRTTPVYVADGPLVAGEPVQVDRLLVREVRLQEGLDRYLRADEDLPVDLVTTRTVGDGEIVPLSAVARGSDLDVRPVAITPSAPLTSAVVEGSTVDLWFVPAPDGPYTEGSGGAADGSTAVTDTAVPAAGPRQLAAGLTVAEVSEPGGALVVGAAMTVHVLVPVDQLPALLTALAADGSVEVVHVPGAPQS
ncbi:hypothetical protein [Cellulomonas sp. KRMCY2]|uniref:hypothetical protein n=1 Tax=Cellulomonas sp. KRMCY2 TaxID=1304865 RepID=UPI0004ACAFB5|nr:hypothetical protein [Cellulomonas sp. KRMCY2]